MADEAVAAPGDAQEVTARAEADLDALHGIAHPDPVAEIVPAIEATYQAISGASHDPHLVDPTFRQQLRHTLSLDGRTPVGRADVSWDIGQKWRPAPPRKPRTTTTKTVTNATQPAAKPSVTSRATARGKRTRLDRLESIVKAARRTQLRSAAAQVRTCDPS